MQTNYKLCAIGNAIVDVLAHTDEHFLNAQSALGMQRGGMTLIDMERALELYPKMQNAVEMCGGSAANTMACFAALGGIGAYMGKVATDRFGKIFKQEMNKSNIHFHTPPLTGSAPTAQCLIFVEENGQRTMNTYLGASVLFNPSDVDENIIASSDITYLEGYLFDKEEAKAAFLKAADFVKKYNKKLALTLSDTFCVERHRADFLNLIENYVDIVFANEFELMALFQTQNLNEAIDKLRQKCALAAVTCGEKGSKIVTKTETISCPAFAIEKIIDSTGAGDAYAAGFLYGLTHHYSLEQCGALGSRVASEIIAQMGPRPQRGFQEFLQHAA